MLDTERVDLTALAAYFVRRSDECNRDAIRYTSRSMRDCYIGQAHAYERAAEMLCARIDDIQRGLRFTPMEVNY